MEVWVIWISNEEQSSIIGVTSSKEIAEGKIAPYVGDAPSYPLRDKTIVVEIDGYNSFFLVPLQVDGDLSDFDAEDYGLGVDYEDGE